jgi:hypothetical protein
MQNPPTTLESPHGINNACNWIPNISIKKRDAYTKDLIKAITNHQALGHDIIGGGDFNDTLFQPNSQLLKLATSVNLIDPWTRLYTGHDNFKTYQRGTNRVDSMLCSHSVALSIRSMGYAH